MPCPIYSFLRDILGYDSELFESYDSSELFESSPSSFESGNASYDEFDEKGNYDKFRIHSIIDGTVLILQII